MASKLGACCRREFYKLSVTIDGQCQKHKKGSQRLNSPSINKTKSEI